MPCRITPSSDRRKPGPGNVLAPSVDNQTHNYDTERLIRIFIANLQNIYCLTG